LSSSTTGSTQGQSLSIIISSVLIFVLLVLFAGVCIYVRKNNSKSPYSKWIQHYPSINAPTLQRADNVDIHHFYNKSPRPSFNQNTVFTPHVSGRISSRNSQIVSPIRSQKNDHRRSFSAGSMLHNI
jgi:hypothetical protein